MTIIYCVIGIGDEVIDISTQSVNVLISCLLYIFGHSIKQRDLDLRGSLHQVTRPGMSLAE